MGTLQLITLPIGNISDITTRAKEALQTGQYFLAEDTRELRKLLNFLDIDPSNKTIECFNDHSTSKINYFLEKLEDGVLINLVSDAGSPIISDPAYPLVKEAVDKGHIIETCPGVSAVTTALELSGLPPHPFHFYGFISREKGKRGQVIEAVNKIPGTHIFFESPNRMESTLEIIAKNSPLCDVVVVREMTKKFETVYRFKASEYLREEINFKGEFVFLVNNELAKGAATQDFSALSELAANYMNKGFKPKALAKLLAKILDEDTNDIYKKLSIK